MATTQFWHQDETLKDWKNNLDKINPNTSRMTFWPVENVRVEINDVGARWKNPREYRLYISNSENYRKEKALWVVWGSEGWREKFIEKVQIKEQEAAELLIRQKQSLEREKERRAEKENQQKEFKVIAESRKQYNPSYSDYCPSIKTTNITMYESNISNSITVYLSNLSVKQQVLLLDKIDAAITEVKLLV